METLKLNQITYSDNGKKINYEYDTTHRIQKFYSKEHLLYSKYNIDVSKTPNSISVIPFLSNMLPISWFAGFDIEVNEVDEDFFYAMEKVKSEFQKQYSDYRLKGSIKAKNLVKNSISGDQSAMLFSGGVDAYATYIRVFEQKPDLTTILGADIEIEDQEQWKDFTNFVENEKLLDGNNKHYIETNVRKFYTFEVELLLKDIGWWGKVQHGLSLIGSLAPLSYSYSYSSIYIASSYTEQVNIAWGSTPEIDEKIAWAGVQVFHDGYELKRQDKVDLIASFNNNTNTKFKLRVCYSEKRTEFNCSNCEKCFRTILGLILNNKNPNDYGFEVDENIYSKFYEILNEGAASKGVKYFWWELMEKAKENKEFYIFNDEEIEDDEIQKIRNGKIDQILETKIQNKNTSKQRLRFIIRNKFPLLKKIYQKIR